MKLFQKSIFILTLMGVIVFNSSCEQAGCTDLNADNYDSKAKKDDGSCVYPEPETNIEPKCEITEPKFGQEILQGENVKIVVKTSDSDGKVKEVQFSVDGNEIGVIRSSPFEFEWNTTGVSLGTHNLKAISVDNKGGRNYHQLDVKIVEKNVECFDESISFKNQKQVDDFLVDYPNCTIINGAVSLSWDHKSDPITNLDGLANITSIKGNLGFASDFTMSDINGLNKLLDVHSLIFYNLKKCKVSGLNNLKYIGGDGSNIVGLRIRNISSLIGLSSLETIDGHLDITHSSLVNLDGLNKLKFILGNVRIVRNEELITISGLNKIEKFETLQIWKNLKLESIEGFRNLKVVRNLDLSELPLLTSIIGFNSLLEIDGVFILDDCGVTYINPLINLKKVRKSLEIVSNNSLISLFGIKNIKLDGIEEIRIIGNKKLKTCHVQFVCDALDNPSGITILIGQNAWGCDNRLEVQDQCQ